MLEFSSVVLPTPSPYLHSFCDIKRIKSINRKLEYPVVSIAATDFKLLRFRITVGIQLFILFCGSSSSQ